MEARVGKAPADLARVPVPSPIQFRQPLISFALPAQPSLQVSFSARALCFEENLEAWLVCLACQFSSYMAIRGAAAVFATQATATLGTC